MFLPNLLVSTLCLLLISSWTFGAEKPLDDKAAAKYEREMFFGEPVRDEKGKLLLVEENKNQTHPKDQFVTVRVKGFKITKRRARPH